MYKERGILAAKTPVRRGGCCKSIYTANSYDQAALRGDDIIRVAEVRRGPSLVPILLVSSSWGQLDNSPA